MTGREIAFKTASGMSCKLVPISQDHLDDCLRMINDPEVAKYLLPRFAFTREQEKDWIDKQVNDKFSVVWTIVELSERAKSSPDEYFVGLADIHDINLIARTATTGLVMKQQYWGRGIASEVMKVRAAYAKNTINLKALYTESFMSNEASRKAAISAGYEEYGQRPYAAFVDGEYQTAWLGVLNLDKL